MALVVFLRGVNVGGHRTFRPTQLAEQLKHLGAINIGAAGTFVIRNAVTPAQVRAEVASRLPFTAQIVVCQARTISRLARLDHFSGEPAPRNAVRFVSVLSRRPRVARSTPIVFPSKGPWLLKIISRQGQFVVGMYRRHMKVIGYLGKLDQVYGVPLTTRNWNTIKAIAKVIEEERT